MKQMCSLWFCLVLKARTVQYPNRLSFPILPCLYLGHFRPFSILLILPGISCDWLIYFFLLVAQVSQLAKSPESAGFILSVFL